MIGHIHGFVASDWVTAKTVAKAILVRRARRPGNPLISYSDLVAQLPLAIDPSDPRLSLLLDEISVEEYSEGRGFLTVLVVHKHGDIKPGTGFYKMARKCGEEFDDEDAFHIRALEEVTRYWTGNEE
ncbi:MULTISPECIES: hypothetical protein [Pseudomonas]|uniref:hypothetical protein n=1 Tax=Pseudomonas TaxID=286 RepID=UPI0023614381|nr:MULTISPECIES: hypothetical protein [Pseudomonas]WJV23175.1 hypothetical protein PSR66_26645 [Pseudomonas chlororaphis]